MHDEAQSTLVMEYLESDLGPLEPPPSRKPSVREKSHRASNGFGQEILWQLLAPVLWLTLGVAVYYALVIAESWKQVGYAAVVALVPVLLLVRERRSHLE